MELNLFKDLLFCIVIIYLIFLAIKKFFKRFPASFLPTFLSPSNTHSIKELLLFLITNRETRIRLFVTLGALILFRIMIFIPVPGINQEAFATLFQGLDGNVPISSSLARFSIFSLGIMPFISACFFIQLLTVVIPFLKKATFGEEEGRYKIVRYTYILTIALALIQSYGLSVWFEKGSFFQGVNIVTMPSVHFRIITMMTLTASCVFLLILADMINKYGIGNGIALIIISGVLIWVFEQVYHYCHLFLEGKIGIFIAVMLITIMIVSLYIAFFFTSREKKIALKDRKTKREITIPLRVSWVANAPLVLSGMIITLPLTIAGFIDHPLLHSIGHSFNPYGISYFIAQGILVFFCTYVYASIIFKPPYIHNLLQKYNFLLKDTGGKGLKDYVDYNLSKILIITAILLFVVPHVPTLIKGLLVPKYSTGVVIVTSVSILTFVGVFFDILSQLEFFYQKSKVSSKKMTVAYVAFDEIEAKIKSEYLKGKGVNALIEPLRFTWGIPIRTAIDQYRIYTPAKDVGKVRKLLE